MKSLRWLGFISLLFSLPAYCGALQSDVALRVEVIPDATLLPGSSATLRVEVTNNGPDTSTALFSWRPTPNGSGFGYPPLSFSGFASGPCFISPVGQPPPGDSFGFWVTSDILPGESRICEFDFVVLDTELLSQSAHWTVGVFFPGMPVSPDDDPDLTNNVAELLLVFSGLVTPHPVPLLSFPGFLLLALVVAVAAYRGNLRAARRQ